MQRSMSLLFGKSKGVVIFSRISNGFDEVVFAGQYCCSTDVLRSCVCYVYTVFQHDTRKPHSGLGTKELVQLQLEFRVSLWIIIGRSCQKYHFFCHDKLTFVETNKHVFCRDKSMLVATNPCLSRQTRVCRDKTRLLSPQKYDCRDKGFVATNPCLKNGNLWQTPANDSG